MEGKLSDYVSQVIQNQNLRQFKHINISGKILALRGSIKWKMDLPRTALGLAANF